MYPRPGLWILQYLVEEKRTDLVSTTTHAPRKINRWVSKDRKTIKSMIRRPDRQKAWLTRDSRIVRSLRSLSKREIITGRSCTTKSIKPTCETFLAATLEDVMK
ncbi:hypothetical protein RRG08_001743 [Elysia crispata]|uniref:Uncharacterized protein n=1 Tax=Elysia crispata TaxID=231223 RepID=A0AAE1AKS2_9GAST|nr:hypothetical protein RRG08_001743 [Elysia crispata]